MSVTIQLLGHASFKLIIDDKILYIDPFGGKEEDYAEKADLILSSHGHRDHSDPEKIALARDDETLILTSQANKDNIEGNVRALNPGEKYEFASIIIHGVPGYNDHRFRSPGTPYHPKEIQTAFIIKTVDTSIYFAGDTDFIDEMKEFKDITAALIPIGGKYTMDPEEAAKAVGAIKPKKVIPMHIRDKDPEKFKELIKKENNEIEVIILKDGEKVTLS
ncbi:MAG: MBL fold metallo-hydrolase [Asgard group archaeon]|nr:MBL fold metallo-hydrolase [Asgard group archaeon]